MNKKLIEQVKKDIEQRKEDVEKKKTKKMLELIEGKKEQKRVLEENIKELEKDLENGDYMAVENSGITYGVTYNSGGTADYYKDTIVSEMIFPFYK